MVSFSPFLNLSTVLRETVTVATHAGAAQKRSFHTDEREEAMRTNWPAYVAAEANRITADEEAFKRLVDRFKQAHGRAPASDCEAYKWGAKMEDAALTAMGFEGRTGFQYNYDLCLMVEYGPRGFFPVSEAACEFPTAAS